MVNVTSSVENPMYNSIKNHFNEVVKTLGVKDVDFARVLTLILCKKVRIEGRLVSWGFDKEVELEDVLPLEQVVYEKNDTDDSLHINFFVENWCEVVPFICSRLAIDTESDPTSLKPGQRIPFADILSKMYAIAHQHQDIEKEKYQVKLQEEFDKVVWSHFNRWTIYTHDDNLLFMIGLVGFALSLKEYGYGPGSCSFYYLDDIIKEIADNHENVDFYHIKEVYEELKNVLRHQSNDSVHLDSVPDNLFDDIIRFDIELDGHRAYNTLLENVVNQSRQSRITKRPKELAQLVATIMNLKDEKVLDLYAGLGEFSEYLPDEVDYDGVESNNTAKILGNMNTMLMGWGMPIFNENAYALVNDEPNYVDDKALIVFPEFNRFGFQYYKDGNGQRKWLPDKNGDATIITDIFSSCFNGKKLCICRQGLLSSRSLMTSGFKSSVRKNVDAVILLPENILPNTSVAPVILWSNEYEKDDNDAILFVDASDAYIQGNGRNRILDVKKVISYMNRHDDSKYALYTREAVYCDYNDFLDPRFYIKADERHYSDDKDKYVQLESVVTLIEGVSDNEPQGRLISFKELFSAGQYFDGNPEVFEYDVLPENSKKIVSPAVLVARQGTLRSIYVNASEDSPVYITDKVMALSFDENVVNPYYLASQISQIDSSAFFDYSAGTILEEYIKLEPDVNVQKRLYEEAKIAFQEAKVRELHLEEIIERQKEDYMNEVRSRKHDMMPHLRNVSCAAKNIDYYIEHKDDFSADELQRNIHEQIVSQQEAIESLTNLLKIFSREEHFGEPSIVNIDKFLTEHYVDGQNYTIDHDTDYQALSDYGYDIPDELLAPSIPISEGAQSVSYAEGINIKIAQDDLLRLCDNIINNAIKHGFTDPERTDYGILSNLTVDKSRGMFVIDFTNNGNPLPKGLDKLRYALRGEKAGMTAGTGEGGYIVKSIAEHYGGDFELYCEDTGGVCRTTIRIYLPIYREDE